MFKTAGAADTPVKASLSQIDVGAVGAARSYVALANAAVDGSERGKIAYPAHREKEASQIPRDWKTNRFPVIPYPASGEIEWAVSKTRGIVIETVANWVRSAFDGGELVASNPLETLVEQAPAPVPHFFMLGSSAGLM